MTENRAVKCMRKRIGNGFITMCDAPFYKNGINCPISHGVCPKALNNDREVIICLTVFRRLETAV